MNHKLSDWVSSTVRASDGDLGTVGQVYFDDLTWIVRYLAVNTGTHASDRLVLISLAALIATDGEKGLCRE